jgi:hypothetical protein
MRERRGAIGRASELAESVVAGMKRRQAARAPKVLLYDEAGRPRTIDATSDGGAALVETARAMVEIAGPDEPAVGEVPEEE